MLPNNSLYDELEADYASSKITREDFEEKTLQLCKIAYPTLGENTLKTYIKADITIIDMVKKNEAIQEEQRRIRLETEKYIKQAKKTDEEIERQINRLHASSNPSSSSTFSYTPRMFVEDGDKSHSKKAMYEFGIGIVLGLISVPLFFLEPITATLLALAAVILIADAIRDAMSQKNMAFNA